MLIYSCCRSFQFYASHPEVGLIIAGGLGSKNVELSEDGISKRHVVELPKQISAACMVFVNASTIFMAGGDNAPKETYYLNLETKEWTDGPKMSVERQKHTCSYVSKPIRRVVIVGGKQKNNQESFALAKSY